MDASTGASKFQKRTKTKIVVADADECKRLSELRQREGRAGNEFSGISNSLIAFPYSKDRPRWELPFPHPFARAVARSSVTRPL